MTSTGSNYLLFASSNDIQLLSANIRTTINVTLYQCPTSAIKPWRDWFTCTNAELFTTNPHGCGTPRCLKPQRDPFGQHFSGRTKIACDTLFLHFDHQRLPIFSQAYLLFFVTLLVHFFLGRFSLVYHESLRDVLFPCCLHFKAHLLHIFRMSVEHFANFLQIFSLY